MKSEILIHLSEVWQRYRFILDKPLVAHTPHQVS